MTVGNGMYIFIADFDDLSICECTLVLNKEIKVSTLSFMISFVHVLQVYCQRMLISLHIITDSSLGSLLSSIVFWIYQLKLKW